jgi:dihydrofolate synthase/folylpolyglutamate synthase
MPTFQSYFEAIRFLEGLSNVPKKEYLSATRTSALYLKRTEYLLKLLGNPHRGIKLVHIGGTAGKGTVAAMVHGALVAQGYRAGLFTSPFATTSIEKIKVGNRYIDPLALARLVEEVKPALDEAYRSSPFGGPSYFELFTAMAFLHFKKAKCKWAVMEVGMGGRFDATNVIEHPVATAVTNIGLDHTEILGNTLEKIAREKAGIIKPRCPFFTTETRPKLLKLFERICRAKKARFLPVGAKNAPYGEKNAALARAICRRIGASEKSIERGITNARLPCRFETVQKKPLVVLDGAHNIAKVESTVANLKNLRYRNLHLVVGISHNKDITGIMKRLCPLARSIAVTRFEVKERKCAHPKELLQLAKKYKKTGVPVSTFLDPRRALGAVLKKARASDAVLVTGSFFLTGALRERWYPEAWVLKNRRSFTRF